MSDEPTKRDWTRIAWILLTVFVFYVLSVGPVYHLAPWLLPLYGPLDWMPGLQWYLTLWGANLYGGLSGQTHEQQIDGRVTA